MAAVVAVTVIIVDGMSCWKFGLPVCSHVSLAEKQQSLVHIYRHKR